MAQSPRKKPIKPRAKGLQPRPVEAGEAAGPPPSIDRNKFVLICEELAATGSKYKACERLGVSYSACQQAIRDQELRGDDSWRELWDEHYDMFRDSLEQAAIARHRDGVAVEFRVGRNGERIPTKLEFSDRMGEVLLKGHFPERFRDRVYHSGTVGLEPVDVFSNLSHKAKREIRAIIMRDLEEQRSVAAEKSAGVVIQADASAMLEDMRREDGDA